MGKDKTLTVQIGKRVREYREYLKLTRERLAELSDLSVNFLEAVENGRKNMSTDSLFKLAKALDISADYIVFGNELPERTDIDILFSSLSRRERELAIELLQLLSHNNR